MRDFVLILSPLKNLNLNFLWDQRTYGTLGDPCLLTPEDPTVRSEEKPDRAEKVS